MESPAALLPSPHVFLKLFSSVKPTCFHSTWLWSGKARGTCAVGSCVCTPSVHSLSEHRQGALRAWPLWVQRTHLCHVCPQFSLQKLLKGRTGSLVWSSLWCWATGCLEQWMNGCVVPRGPCDNHHYFLDKEAASQRALAACLGSHSWSVVW